MERILSHFGVLARARGLPPTAVVWILPFPFVYSEAVPVILVDHPLVHDTLLALRNTETDPEKFRRLAVRISVLLVSEAMRDLPTTAARVSTPLGPAHGRRIGADVVVVPVLRAGLGMLDAVLELWPAARVGHIGLQRDETTAVASQYYAKLPAGLRDSYVLVIDPMLATGGSAVAALALLRDAGARDIRIICIVAAPEGIALVEREFPAVRIYTPVVDEGLNDQKYIVPGLGDFGDRLYGTL
jgi:uracil phosphoribosyltransferase